jgi:hypothetical protein
VYFFFIGAPHAQRGLPPATSPTASTSTSQPHWGLLQCQRSAVFANMIATSFAAFVLDATGGKI